MPERYKLLREELAHNPQTLKRMFAALNNEDVPLDDYFIDDVLGLPPLKGEMERRGLVITKGGRLENLDYQGTSYGVAREVNHWVGTNDNDVTYDLGCGYGRFCLWGALTTDTRYKGIELDKKRILVANEIKDKFSIPNVEFIQGNVRDQDLQDGTIFYHFNPFTRSALKDVTEKLRKVAKTKPITVVSYYTWEREEVPSWLRLTRVSAKYPLLFMFNST